MLSKCYSRSFLPLVGWQRPYQLFSSKPPKSDSYIISDPKDYTKFLFNAEGKCKIFEHKRGDTETKWMTRAAAAFTLLNSFLAVMEYSDPVFGGWNAFAFNLCAGMGYTALLMMHVFSRRIVHKAELQSNLKVLDLTFFNAFWKPQTVSFHISEFQYPVRSFAGYTRFELTSLGKIWINLDKNEFRNVKDYEEVLEYIFSGKPLEPYFMKSKEAKARRNMN